MPSPDTQVLLDGGLREWLSAQTDMRKQAKRTTFRRWMLILGIGIPVTVMAGLIFGFHNAVVQIAGLAIIGLGTTWGQAPVRNAKKHIKVGINSAIAKALGFAYGHDVTPGIEFDLAEQFGMLPRYERSSFEDMWGGALKGHDFALYEAHLEEERGSGKSRRWVTVLRGAIIRVNHGLNLHGFTLLQRKGERRTRSWFGFGSRKDSITCGSETLQFVDQVHPDFEDAFDVWGTDQVEAKQVMDPLFVEQLIGIENAFSAYQLRALFDPDYTIIVIETEDMFESGAIDARGDAQRVETARKQFASLAEFAEGLNQATTH